MGNMSYCRFENTFNDLEDCYQALCEDGAKKYEEDANQHEKPYIEKLIRLCRDIAEEFEIEFEN